MNVRCAGVNAMTVVCKSPREIDPPSEIELIGVLTTSVIFSNSSVYVVVKVSKRLHDRRVKLRICKSSSDRR